MARELGDIVLKKWQMDLLHDLEKEPDPRKIIWFVDRKGNTGKTYLSKYLLANKKAARFENGRSTDIKYAYKGERIVIFDLTRSQEEHFNYEVLENIKNGIMFSGKYESAMKVFPVPHVVVFANWGPNVEKLSHDRWDLRSIDDAECQWVFRLASDIGVKKEVFDEVVVLDSDDDDVLLC